MTSRSGLPTILGQEMWRKLNEPRNVAKGETWREMKRQNRDLSYLDFEMSPVYEALIKQYDDALRAEFEQPARPAGAAQSTGARRPAPATRQPAPQGQAYGNARSRLDQLLGE